MLFGVGSFPWGMSLHGSRDDEKRPLTGDMMPKGNPGCHSGSLKAERSGMSPKTRSSCIWSAVSCCAR
jgi:hypothetical protein